MKPAGAGYSATPLPRKLGLRSGMRWVALNAPPDLETMLAGAPELRRLTRVAHVDCALAFVTSGIMLRRALEKLVPRLADAGMIWVAWPKKASGVPSELSEDVVRRAGLAAGLVDVKVCAIDATWSGLKFVRRLGDRRG